MYTIKIANRTRGTQDFCTCDTIAEAHAICVELEWKYVDADGIWWELEL